MTRPPPPAQMVDAADSGQGTIESQCSAVLETIEEPLRKRRRGRPRSKKNKKQSTDKTIPTPLAVGRRTRMSIKVQECLDNCHDKIDELMTYEKEKRT